MMTNKRLLWKIVTAALTLIFLYYFVKILFAGDFRVLHFATTQCTVKDKKLNQQQAVIYNQHTQQNTRTTMYQPLFLVSYSVNNKSYQKWTFQIENGYVAGQTLNEAILNHFEIGKSYQCWYDPTNPGTVVLSKLSWLLVPFLITAVLISLYIAILVIRLIIRILALI